MNKKYPQIQISENTYYLEIDSSFINVDEEKIGYEIGYQNGGIPEHFSGMIKEILSSIESKCNIKAGYTIVDLKFNKEIRNQLEIGNQIFLTDKIVTSQLKKSEKAVLFLCTIGNEMENWSKELYSSGESIMSYLANISASAVVEKVADLLHSHINNFASDLDLSATNRYSPGYCNWSVAEQSKLFSFFPKEFCGVTLSESNLMTPIKSVSGIIGIGKEAEYKEYLCDRCGIKDCTHRIYLTRKYKNKTDV
ncbi:MAG: hypothetical protein H6609_04750 [Ignavibacteriales bacterium]|nr:hypothetical protein [Ignavibacteriales bacterium]